MPHFPVATHPDIKKIVEFKANLTWRIRTYLREQGALEVPMPVLQATREGAPVDQWTTTDPHTGKRWYLRHCMEDHLRRVSIAHDRVFEIGKAIRADRRSPSHASEFLVLELVFRRFTYENGIDLIRGLYTEAIGPAADDVYGNGAAFRGIVTQRWRDILEQATGIDSHGDELIADSKRWLTAHSITPERPYVTSWEVLEDIMKHAVEPACTLPTIITHFPAELCHVCTIESGQSGQPRHALRASSVVNGVECSDGGIKFRGSTEYRQVYETNAAYRETQLGLDGNHLPEEFFADLDTMTDATFTTGMGIDRIAALVSGNDIQRVLIFPEG
ncbi:amino acid--tRNA ligase-related protein [Nocardia sp. BMG51109]|uniref:amino acid--tRNA ligase-related protein n=1 Tax=Nocardia sp. BMG51109 TaxID=1056816 RepID=UPI000465B111|nr:amino acid--tRNA ligase-related protein [Nocardia sp. BMG51109]